MTIQSGEFLFVKSVKDGIPNRDPLADSDARRLFDEEDGRISLSDVSVKRDVRDLFTPFIPMAGRNGGITFLSGRNGTRAGRSSTVKSWPRRSGTDPEPEKRNR